MALGGGAHHARRNHGEGWCFFADITLGIHKLRRVTQNKVQRVLYIDCDVHQGNGVEHDKLHFKDADLYVLDVYNTGRPFSQNSSQEISGSVLDIWPQDYAAKKGIDLSVEVHCGARDDEYLEKLKMALDEVRSNFQPDLIVYNAGTDILSGDQLGCLHVTPQGVIQRDEMVFQHAMDVKAPIVMLLSGGYTKNTHQVIADSILNLTKKFHLPQP